MKQFYLIGFVVGAALFCSADNIVTNSVTDIASTVASTNAPTKKVVRTQCEAITKSGTQCKRYAVIGEKLCRQHQKIESRKKDNLKK